MKVLVTGSQGMLGSSLCPVMAIEHSVSALAHQDLDITDTDKTIQMITDLRPDIVMHLASNANVDECELHPDLAYRVNSLGTWNVAAACHRCDATMVYISTDGVFDGTKGEPYTEFDSTNPLSIYSKSKLAGESYVKSILTNFYIVRAGWMFGGRERDKKFVGKILELAAKNSEIKAVNDKIGSPIYTYDLSVAISKLIRIPLYGTYHIANKGFCSRYEFAKKIVEYAGLDVNVKPVDSSVFKLASPRPPMTPLRNYCLDLLGKNDLRPWEDALKDYIETLKRNGFL